MLDQTILAPLRCTAPGLSRTYPTPPPTFAFWCSSGPPPSSTPSPSYF